MSVIVIAGPTASGKTKLGVELAKRLDGEIISCDSMQIYKELPICSAQPTEEEKEGIPHHLMGFLPFDARFTAEDYRVLAEEKLRDIISRGKQPIIVGGTGMYFHFLIYKADFLPENEEIRKKLNEFSTEELYERLRGLDEGTAIAANDRKRISRALEVYEITGKLPPDTFKERTRNTEFDYRLFCISPERQVLYDKINRRVDIMLENGLVDEVKRLYELGINESHQSYKAIGCRQLKEYFEGKISLSEAAEKIRQDSRHYAKRQLTWMRGEDAHWLNGTLEENINSILEKK